jgi:hypothetical protein
MRNQFWFYPSLYGQVYEGGASRQPNPTVLQRKTELNLNKNATFSRQMRSASNKHVSKYTAVLSHIQLTPTMQQTVKIMNNVYYTVIDDERCLSARVPTDLSPSPLAVSPFNTTASYNKQNSCQQCSFKAVFTYCAAGYFDQHCALTHTHTHKPSTFMRSTGISSPTWCTY